eukprot:CAMPEP_0206145362 /NCGR_PEP_ID=MMETSP1473-20131121/27130_1 /ASSEMBLY_ACC=CAM_ASM_001109 /TAXON_ID=1461547 /ORGANISM="Stichococcus sp, Strain RCC1054" /LENGTH=216 /DNA_ID=CAMNT_0053541535 /DNA_START=203 /DNA_END=850 /DNA_ORIENTATION=+
MTTQQLVADLRTAAKAGKGFWDAEVREGRARLAAHIRGRLLDDYNAAQKEGVEQVVWREVFYRPIQEFQRRLRHASQAGDAGREALRKGTATWEQFLSKTASWYRAVIQDVQAVHGHCGCRVTFADDGAPQVEAAPDSSVGAAEHEGAAVDVRPTVARCLICLGDLARYDQVVKEGGQEPHAWRPAALCYRAAAAVVPSCGNAYSQLAVLSTYEGD